jgi:subtilisin-like proprotein convertase family protein
LRRIGFLLTLAAVLLAVAPVPPGTSARDDATHLVIVPDSPKAQAALIGSAARTIARYDSFTLVEATGADVVRLVSLGGEVRDDMRQVRIGTRSFDPTTSRPSLRDKTGAAVRQAGTGGRGLAVVQYVGPLKDSWVGAVRKTGVEVVSYMAQNGQLVSGDEAALDQLADLSTRAPFIRAITPFTAEDKQLPGLHHLGRTEIVVSTVAGDAGASARADVRSVSERLGDEVPVAGIVQQRIELDGAHIKRLAQLGGVVAIEPFVAPTLLDERAALIVAGRLNASFQPVLGAGYRSYLIGQGFPSLSPIVIDITDEGIDKGVVPVPAGSHPDFYSGGLSTNPSRIVYAQENTAADIDARDCGGHGTNVASIATGFNTQTGATFEDAQGFNYGMGIQPFGRVGATKVFNCAGSFDVQTSVAALHSNAFANGARISNNSWGANTGGAYTTLSQQFDALVRDAQSGVAGNQQLTEVVSAGNAGAGSNTVGAPGTAKNVITVGASENVRLIGGPDGCLVPDSGADSARDVINFSSRGPTDDARTKPDIVAPGTHVTGAQPQSVPYNGSGTCNSQFPAGSTLYTLVSGTSQAAPEVTGLASLLRTWFRSVHGGGTKYPSPAMTKALMVNTATNLVGGADGLGGVNGPRPTQIQGWGRVNLGTVLDGTSRQVVDQSAILSTTGTTSTRYYPIASATRPLRVTLVWTDAVGPTIGNSFVNDLDLEVIANGVSYKGNVFSGGRSVAGGVADPRNNVENVFLPPGVSGTVRVRVTATNIAGDGIPGNGDTTDQDFALVVSNANAAVASTAILVDAGRTIALGGDGDALLEPNEPFTVAQKLRNLGNATATSLAGTMSTPPSDATITQASSAWPNLAAGATATGSPPFGATVKPTLVCGDLVDLTVQATGSGGVAVTIPFGLRTGRPGGPAITVASTDVPKAIPDNDPNGIVSNLPIGASGFVSDLNVTIGSLTHTFDGDLAIDLISPAGTTVRLFNHHGGSGDNLANTVFDDEATTSISAGVAPFTGSFRPFQPLSAFDGQQVTGTWKLRIVDDAIADVGTLHSWSLTRRNYVCP